MGTNELMKSNEPQEKEPIIKDYYLGKLNIKVRLASDMDYRFLERLRRVLDENSNIKNYKN